MRNTAAQIALALIAGFALLSYGGITTPEWNIVLLALCCCSLLYWAPGEASRFAPAPPTAFSLLLLAFVAWVAAQLIPLPFPWIQFLSPARAGLTGQPAAPFHPRWLPLTASPASTWAYLMRICGYILVFFLVRDLSSRLERRMWLLTVPLILFAVGESAIGLTQSFTTGNPASGTYVNADHFAGLLEMLLPFPVMLAAGLYRDLRRERTESMAPAALICLLLGASALTFSALLASRSRMSPAAMAVSIVIMCGLGFRHGRGRVWGGLAALAGIGLLLLATPLNLIQKYAQPTQLVSGEITSEARFQIWRETWEMIRHYPVFGSGLGTFVSVFQKYRTSAPMLLVDYAHNDYLQIFAECGAIGFLIAMALLFLTLRGAFRAGRRELNPRNRDIAIACAAGLSAIAVHSTVEFHFYLPATMLIVSWVAGLAAGRSVWPPLDLTPLDLAKDARRA